MIMTLNLPTGYFPNVPLVAATIAAAAINFVMNRVIENVIRSSRRNLTRNNFSLPRVRFQAPTISSVA